MDTRTTRRTADDLRAATSLVVGATQGVTEAVEAMHRRIASGPALLGKPLAAPAGLVTGLVYGGIKGITRGVGKALDLTLAQLAPALGETVPGPERLALLAALNGVVGDRLAAEGNALALPMALCRDGVPLHLTREALAQAILRPSSHVVVLVHGSSMNDLQWARKGHEHGLHLEGTLGATSVRVRYNTGLHVSQNGALLDALLEELVAAWPVRLSGLTLLAHSMGGLVARSACAAGARSSRQWLRSLRSLVFLGTPHDGAPLERAGNLFGGALALSSYSRPLAALAKIRSAGVTDLRHGFLLEEDWAGVDRFSLTGDRRTPVPLPAGVRCFAVAGSLSPSPTKRPRSDGLVPVASALGLHLPESHQHVVFGAGHLDLLNAPEVTARLEAWLTA